MQRCRSTKNSYISFTAGTKYFSPPFTTGLLLHSQVGDVYRGSCGKEDLDKSTNSSVHFATQEWVALQSPALCHPLCLPRPANAKVQCRALRRSWGGIFLYYLQGNIGREGGLDAYSAVLGAQLGDSVWSARETVKR